MKHLPPDKAIFTDTLAEALLEAQAPILPAPERARALRERVLGEARQARGAEAKPAPDSAAGPGHLTIRDGEGRWIKLMPGVSMKPLREDADTRSYLLRLAPGTSLPGHEHSRDEECLVLEGEIWLGDVLARAGDYHLARSGLPHGVVRTDTGCLLFLRGQKHYAGLGAG